MESDDYQSQPHQNQDKALMELSSSARHITPNSASPVELGSAERKGEIPEAPQHQLEIENARLRLLNERLQALNVELASEERFRAIINQSTAGITEVDLSGRFLLVNDHYCDIVGYTREELLSGMRMQDITHPHDLPHNLALYEELLRNGTPFVIEKRYVRKDGSIVSVSNSVSLVRDAQGNPNSVIAVSVDITERQQVEDALRQAHQQTTHILESITDCFYTLDNQWRFTYVNQQMEAYFGIPKEQFLGRTVVEVLPKIHEHQILLRLQEAVAEQKEVEFESHSPRTGQWVEFRALPAVDGLTVYFRDITQRKQAEAASRLSEEKYRLLWATAGDAFVLFDRNSIIQEANAAVETIFGYAPEEVIGRDLALLQPERFREGHRRGLQRYLDTGSRTLDWSAAEALGLHRDGHEIPIEIAFNHLHLEGQDLFAGFIRDITQRKQAEVERAELLAREQAARQELEDANRLKDEFLSTMSHELRTPLNAILGWAHLLRAGGLDEASAAQAAETIERNARSQVRLIEDLMDVSRIVTGKLRLDVGPVALADVVQAAADAVRPAAQAKNIRFQVLLDPEVGPVAGDPDRLQQVVWNLLSNALKFTPPEGRVQVRLERVNSHVAITVSDSGQGISPEFLPHVFDRFRQADSSHTRSVGGLGLGLTIVRQLVELHGGTVHAASAGKGQGATFTISLPLTTAHEVETASRTARSTEAGSPHEEGVHSHASGRKTIDCPTALKGLKVLVVDDETDSRELIIAVLQQCEALVTASSSVSEALEAIDGEQFDILVSDIGMPGEDGYSLIQQVRARPPQSGGRIPAVALTAYARAEDRIKALASGFQMHVPKPIEPTELVVIIASLAEGPQTSSKG